MDVPFLLTAPVRESSDDLAEGAGPMEPRRREPMHRMKISGRCMPAWTICARRRGRASRQ